MKKLLLAIVYATFSLAIPLAMAQSAIGQEQAATQSVEKEAPTSVKINFGSSSDKGENENVVVEIDGDFDDRKVRRAEKKIEAAVEKLGNVFGESLAANITIELDELSDEEKKELGEEIGDLFDGNSISFDSDGGNMGPGEVLVALVAISFTLGLPIIILLMVFIFRQRKRKQMVDLADAYIRADQPMPAHVMAEFGTGMSSDTRLRKGLLLTFVGIALTVVLFAINDIETATIGLIPIAVGVSRLVFWKMDTDKAAKEEQSQQLSHDV